MSWVSQCQVISQVGRSPSPVGAWEPNTPYQPRSNQHVKALDRAGARGGADLHPGKPAVDSPTFREVETRMDCNWPFRPSQGSGYYPRGSRGKGVPMEEVPTYVNIPSFGDLLVNDRECGGFQLGLGTIWQGGFGLSRRDSVLAKTGAGQGPTL